MLRSAPATRLWYNADMTPQGMMQWPTNKRLMGLGRAAWVFVFGLTALLALPPGTRAEETEAAPKQESIHEQDYAIRRWIVDDGLPHNTASRAVQDGRGYLWLSTGAGLTRFTGSKFTTYNLADTGAVPKMLGENIRDLALDGRNTLVFLPAGGGVMMMRDGNILPHPSSSELSRYPLLELFIEPDGTLWTGTTTTESKLLLRWSKGTLQRFEPKVGAIHRSARMTFARDNLGRVWAAGGEFLGWYHDGQLTRWPLLQGTDFCIAPSRTGGIWVSTGEQLAKIEGNQITTLGSGKDWAEVTKEVRGLMEDDRSTLWIATRRHGLYHISDGKPVQSFKTNDVVMSVMEDSEGNIWATTEGAGILRLRPKVHALLNHSMGMPEDISLSVTDDSTGTLWCANRGGGLLRVSGGRIESIVRESGQNAYVYAVVSDKSGTIWAGAADGLLCYKPGTDRFLRMFSPETREIRVLYRSQHDEIWIATADNQLKVLKNGVLTDLTEAVGFDQRRVGAITEDANGTVWVATIDQILVGFTDGRRTHRYTRNQFPGGGNFQAALIDALGSLCLGTTQGLLVKNGDRFVPLTEKEGLPDDMIYQLLDDKKGRLWVGSRRGIYFLPIGELHAVISGKQSRVNATMLGKDEGLPSTSANDGAQPNSWHAKDGRLWFATHAGLIGIDPNAFIPERPGPRLHLDKVLIDQIPVPRDDQLIIPPGRHRVDFIVDALDYTAPEKVHLQHQLVGLDNNWVETKINQDISYTGVPSGKYTLRVVATNQDRRRNEQELRLEVVVVPAWWERWWFRAGCGLVFTGAVVWLARLWSHRRLKNKLARLEHEHALDKERARIARNLHDELGGSATQLGMLAERLKRHGTNPEMMPLLGQMAWKARRLAGEVESIVWTVSPKNNTWDRLADFLNQFCQGFATDSGLDFCSDGIDSIPALPLSPEAQHHILAATKEAMNNIVKHAHAKNVTLTLSAADGVFTLSLRDDGIGFNPIAPEHAERNGLTNMHTRLAEIGGECSIESSPGSGSVVRFRTPLATQQASAAN